MALSQPLDTTIRRLFAVSSNRCAFPGCQTPILDSTSNTILAEVCHIHARKPGGPRYKPEQTGEELHGFDNLMLMCGTHHKLIDAPENEARFDADTLREMKKAHESKARQQRSSQETLSDQQLAMLLEAASAYNDQTVHNDFRNATFKVGGEGGHLGGSGGEGGVLTIIGTTRLPASASLAGESGRSFGAGGGGGGVIEFLGRPIEADDVAKGLRLSSMFVTSSANYSTEGLLNALGAVWAFVRVPRLPHRILLNVVFVLEVGALEPTTLLRLVVRVTDASGACLTKTDVDVEVPQVDDLVKRVSRVVPLDFQSNEYGVLTIEMCSSEHCLGRYDVECRPTEPV